MRRKCPPREGGVKRICELLARYSRGRLGDLFGVLPSSRPTGTPCTVFRRTSSAIQDNMVVNLNSELRMFRGRTVYGVATCSRVSVRLPKRGPYTCFYVADSRSDAFSFLSSLFLSFIFVGLIECTSGGYRNNGLPMPIRILNRRLATYNIVPSLDHGVDIVHSHGLDVDYIFRGLTKLRGECPLGR